MVNFPVFFTSDVATVASSSSTLEQSPLFTPHLAAKASAMPVFDMATTDFFFM